MQTQHLNTPPQFSLATAAYLVALCCLLGSVTYSLMAFLPLPMALAIGAVFVYVFGKFVEMLISGHLSPMKRFLVLIAAVTMGLTSLGLSASTLWANMFSRASMTKDYAIKRDHAERSLMQIIGLAQTASSNLEMWRTDALQKAQQEKTLGGSCASSPNTRGERGPIFFYRQDDERLAQSLANELKLVLNQAETELTALRAMPAPKDVMALNSAIESANRAIDAGANLAKSGSFSAAAAKALKDRGAAVINVANGRGLDCGDGARQALIARASTAFETLSQVEAPSRVSSFVDLTDRSDIIVMGWLRGFNGALSILSFGRLGNFSSDPLWSAAMKKDGVINRETLSFLLSALIELAVVSTALIAKGNGTLPFPSQFIEHVENESPTTRVGRFFHSLKKLWGNLCYRVPSSETLGKNSPPEMEGEVLAPVTELEPVPLGADPLLPKREELWAKDLLPFHMPWGDDDYIIFPQSMLTKPILDICNSMRSKGQMTCLTSSASAEQFQTHPYFKHTMHQTVGADWKNLAYSVFKVAPEYAQQIRLTSIATAAASAPVSPRDTNRDADRGHVQLSGSWSFLGPGRMRRFPKKKTV